MFPEAPTPPIRSKDHAVKHAIGILQHFHPVPQEVERFMLERSRLLRVKRGEVLLRAGETCGHYFFIIRGALRGYSESEHAEITTWITLENEMATSIHGMHERRPMLESIQAIEDSVLVALAVDDLEELYSRVPEFNLIARKILQVYYGHAEIRALLARISHAENKYRFFLEHFPQLSNRIPLKTIASFLGIRYETLSRIRKKQLQKH